MSLPGVAFDVLKAGAGAVGGLAKGISSMLSSDDKKEEAAKGDTTVINNFGIAGGAGQQKVVGRGTIPGAQNAAKPNLSNKMPTDKLLHVAVNYLASIDNSLRAQLEFDKSAFEDKKMAEREALIEKKSFDFGGLKDGIKQYGSEVAGRGSFAAKAILATLLGGMVLGNLIDEKKLDALKENIDKFSKDYQWLFDVAKAAAPFGFVGWLFGGLRGAIMGAIGGIVGEKIAELTGSNKAGVIAGGAAAIGTGALMLPKWLGGGKVRSFAGRMVMKAAEVISAPMRMAARGIFGFAKTQARKLAAWAADKLFAKLIFMTIGRGKMWNLFVKFMASRGGQWILNRIATIATVQATTTAIEAGTAATGVGIPVAAVLGAVEKLIAAGFTIKLLLDMYDFFKEFYNDPDYKDQIQAIEAEKAKNVSSGNVPNAVKQGSQTDSPPASASNQSAPSTESLPPAASGSIDAILDKTPDQLSDAELRQLVEAQGRIEDPRGVTNNPGGIRYGTGPLQDHQIGYKRANGDSSVKIAVYDTPENGIRAAMENWRTSKYYKGYSIRDGLGMWSTGHYGRNPNYEKMLGSARAGYEGTSSPQGETDSIVSQGLQAIGTLAGKLAGTAFGQSGATLKNLTTPLPDYSAIISRETKKIEDNINFGIKKDNQKESVSGATSMASKVQSALSASTPNKTVECIDPNYPDRGGIMAFLGHYKLVAA